MLFNSLVKKLVGSNIKRERFFRKQFPRLFVKPSGLTSLTGLVMQSPQNLWFYLKIWPDQCIQAIELYPLKVVGEKFSSLSVEIHDNGGQRLASVEIPQKNLVSGQWNRIEFESMVMTHSGQIGINLSLRRGSPLGIILWAVPLSGRIFPACRLCSLEQAENETRRPSALAV